MAIIEYDDEQSLEAQTRAILAAATATGHGAHEVTWDPATRSHIVPDDVAEAYAAGPDGVDGTSDDPPKKRRGRPAGSRNKPKDQPAGSDASELSGPEVMPTPDQQFTSDPRE